MAHGLLRFSSFLPDGLQPAHHTDPTGPHPRTFPNVEDRVHTAACRSPFSLEVACVPV